MTLRKLKALLKIMLFYLASSLIIIVVSNIIEYIFKKSFNLTSVEVSCLFIVILSICLSGLIDYKIKKILYNK